MSVYKSRCHKLAAEILNLSAVLGILKCTVIITYIYNLLIFNNNGLGPRLLIIDSVDLAVCQNTLVLISYLSFISYEFINDVGVKSTF